MCPRLSQTVVGFLYHCRGPTLVMLILKAGGAPRRVPRLGVQDVCRVGRSTMSVFRSEWTRSR